MNKKILAAAVAGALALPGLAFAQAAGVTISGTLAVGIGTQKVTSVNFGGATPRGTAAAPFNTKGTRINDEVSVLTFGIVEPLGGGMEAFGQFQMRPCLDANNQTGAPAGMLICSNFSESFVGLRNVRSWGQVKMGSITTAGTAGAGRGGDLTAGIASADMLSTTGTMQGTAIAPAGVGAAVAQSTAPVNIFSGRIPSSIQWVSPDWSGFNVRAGYSTSGNGGGDADMSGALRKGSFVTISPEYIATNWNVGATWVDAKNDNIARNAKALQIWGTIKFGALRTSLIWGNMKVTNLAASAGTAAGVFNAGTGVATGCAVAAGSTTNPYTCSDKLGDADRWMLTGDYSMGPHTFAAAYVRVRDDKVLPGDTAAKQLNLAYAYKLSNRTSVGLGYVRVNNGANVAYPITGAGGSYLEVGANINNGEDASWYGAGIKHTF